jgi:beta-glucosidase/6-phospho-beta-glucosidase/beta-galactosidase
MLTLHHYASPAWAVNPERDIWQSGEAAELFERFVTKVVGAVGDLVDLYGTLNEPNALVFHGWGEGTLPPYKKDFRLVMRIAENMVRAHARAYRAIHRLKPGAQVGLPINFLPLVPAAAALAATAPVAAPAADLPALEKRPLRILLVEDHGDTARIMRRLLVAEGHEVENAADVATALQLAGANGNG